LRQGVGRTVPRAPARRLGAVSGGRDLLTLGALANQPLRDLTRIGPYRPQVWRRGDGSTVAAAAALVLRSLGPHPTNP
jgi:hypothetical protein